MFICPVIDTHIKHRSETTPLMSLWLLNYFYKNSNISWLRLNYIW